MTLRHAPTPPPTRATNADVLDYEGLRERAGNDTELITQILCDFLRREDVLSDLRSAAATRSFDTLANLAHRLKATLLALGAHAAADAASDVEVRVAMADSAMPSPNADKRLSEALTRLDVRIAEARAAMREHVSSPARS